MKRPRSAMRVLHVLPRLGVGGAEILTVHLACAFDASQFEVGIACFFDSAHEPLLQRLRDQGIPIWTLGKRDGADPRVVLRLHACLESFKPDIVHTHQHVLPYVLAASSGKRIRGIVHTIHSVAEKEAKPIGQLIQRMAFGLGVLPVAISVEVLTSMGRVYGLHDCPLIPNAIPVAAFRAGERARVAWRQREGVDPQDVLVACVARLWPPKNHSLLLEAFAEVAPRQPRARLLIVGDGEERAKLEDLARSLGLTAIVRFLGSREDVPELLAAADVFALASDWEGNPLSVMEAMASGLSVVCTAVGGVPELVDEGRTGFLVPAGDSKALAARLGDLIGNPDLRHSMGKAGALKAGRRFDLPAMADAYGTLYTRLARSSPHGGLRQHG